MSFSPCPVREDPFTRQVRSTYRASVVKVPRTGIDPLDALAVRARRVEPRGRLLAMIEGAPPTLAEPTLEQVADLSGSRTTSVDVGLGVDLTATFLAALGVPIASARAAASLWKHAARISFEIRDVHSREIDLAELGRALAGRRLERNPATEIFFTDPATRLLVITRTLISSSFAVRAEDSRGRSGEAAVEGLAKVLGELGANVSWEAENQDVIAFSSATPATFAFSAVPCAVRPDGSVFFGLASAELTLGPGTAAASAPAPVVDEPGLLTFDPWTPPTPISAPIPDPDRGSVSSAEALVLDDAECVRGVPDLVPGQDESAPAGAAVTEPEPVPPQTGRWINAVVEDHHPSEPLQLGLAYTLAFDVDLAARENALGATRLVDAPLFADQVDEVRLTVQLDSDDFEISEPARPLWLPRTGRSRGKARFDLTARREGRCFLSATIHRDGNFIQKLDLSVSVGSANAKPVTVTSVGRPAAAAVTLLKRDLMLVIEPAAAAGYTCTVVNDGAGFGRINLPIQEDELSDAVNTARQALMSVVSSVADDGSYIFQTGLDIPEPQQRAALHTLARAGARLFQKIFLPNAAGLDLAALAQHLRTIAGDPDVRLQLQIVTNRFPVPWGLLYLGDVREGAELSWEHFVGVRHIVEQLPLLASFAAPPRDIVSDNPALVVSVALNSSIDATMQVDFVARQNRFWTEVSRTRHPLRVTTRELCGAVVQSLASADNDDALIYFYCHATAPELGADGGLDTAALGLSDAVITLGDLNLDAPREVRLRGHPLVFINACESAGLSPRFYEGFVPYFLAKGARGVIGTECKVPALFAEAWAQRFFELFFSGPSLGETFLSLRRYFLAEHGNPLGLLYGVTVTPTPGSPRPW